jgi:RNA recognition motif-containing protein
VLKAKIFTTKNKQNPTCFGYVTLTDPETADLCIENANRLNFKGRVIHVEKVNLHNFKMASKNLPWNKKIEFYINHLSNNPFL